MRATIATIGASALLSASLPAAAQEIKAEPDQQYLVIEVTKLSTFEKELNSAAKHGFRLMKSATSEEGQRIQALMERVDSPGRYQYRMVATFSEKTGDKEMNAAAAEGFRLLPHTAMVKQGLTVFNRNSVVIMERASESVPAVSYMTISAARTSTFHKELKAAIAEGWRVVDMTYGQILLERVKS